MNSACAQIEQLNYPDAFALTLGLEEPLEASLIGCGIRNASTVNEALGLIDHPGLRVLVIGPKLIPLEVRELMDRVEGRVCRPRVILSGMGEYAEGLRDYESRGIIFFISHRALCPPHVLQLVNAAIAANCPIASEANDDTRTDYHLQLNNQTDLQSLLSVLTQAVLELLQADRVHCLLLDMGRGIFYGCDGEISESTPPSLGSGLVAYVARTGERVTSEDLDSDPRYAPEIDNPGGTCGDRLIAAPVFGGSGIPVAIVMGIRSSDASAFNTRDMNSLLSLIEAAGPPLTGIVSQRRLECRSIAQMELADVFRREALDYHTRGSNDQGNLLRTSPRWLINTHRVMIALLLSCLIFAMVARDKEQVIGPSVIHLGKRITVTASARGSVRFVDILVGELVRRGDPIAELDHEVGETKEPSSEHLVAPCDGLVVEVLVRPGQEALPGEEVAEILDTDSGYQLISLIPLQYAPQISRGMQVTFRVDGYSDTSETAVVEDFGAEITNPSETVHDVGMPYDTRVLGPRLVVHSRLERPIFLSGRMSYEYFDGMTATSTVSLRSQPLIVELFPAARQFFARFR